MFRKPDFKENASVGAIKISNNEQVAAFCQFSYMTMNGNVQLLKICRGGT